MTTIETTIGIKTADPHAVTVENYRSDQTVTFRRTSTILACIAPSWALHLIFVPQLWYVIALLTVWNAVAFIIVWYNERDMRQLKRRGFRKGERCLYVRDYGFGQRITPATYLGPGHTAHHVLLDGFPHVFYVRDERLQACDRTES